MGIQYVPLQNTYILLWYIHSLNGSEFFDEIEFYPVFIAVVDQCSPNMKLYT